MGDTRTDTPATTTRVHHHDDVAVVEVVGEIDMACETPVRTALVTQLDQRPAGLVVDLTEVDFFGSAGIQLLVEAIERAERRGVALAVATDRRAVLRPLEITLVREVVDVHPTLADAIAAVRADDLPQRRRVAHQ
ncbi:anti-anti-sigma factor [Saccharothrix carnea]|uniref:Anti-sigma factor antagonist n=1 Tax=Saccharothrix carnea TaxID=1280637 RepID=A0A2P8HZP3_SACCR|nr:STAS domain-containing protein [Saccharothrix carnea]PSL51664.1 anti-anti-sigma factor [Saccharothrix carnea]